MSPTTSDRCPRCGLDTGDELHVELCVTHRPMREYLDPFLKDTPATPPVGASRAVRVVFDRSISNVERQIEVEVAPRRPYLDPATRARLVEACLSRGLAPVEVLARVVGQARDAPAGTEVPPLVITAAFFDAPATRGAPDLEDVARDRRLEGDPDRDDEDAI